MEFATIATSTVRELSPKASVEHQASTFPSPWVQGVTAPLAAQNDFLQGDFYGTKLQGSFVRKLLEDLTPNRPFGYETSFSLNLQDHTAMKSEALLEAKAAAAIADQAAFIFIDAIDPIGTVNPRAHDRMGKVFDRLMPYYAHLGGDRVADVGVFYGLESKFSFSGNGRNVRQADLSDSHTPAVMQAASRLISAHVPFTVVTKNSMAKLKGLRVLILSNVNAMDNEECADDPLVGKSRRTVIRQRIHLAGRQDRQAPRRLHARRRLRRFTRREAKLERLYPLHRTDTRGLTVLRRILGELSGIHPRLRNEGQSARGSTRSGDDDSSLEVSVARQVLVDPQ